MDWIYRSQWSIEDVARILGVTRTTVYWWISGEREPRLSKAFAIERISKGKVPIDAWRPR